MTNASTRERLIDQYPLRAPLAYRGTVYVLDVPLSAEQADTTAGVIAAGWTHFQDEIKSGLLKVTGADARGFRLSDEKVLVRQGSEDPKTGAVRGPLVSFPKFWFTARGTRYLARYSINVCRGRANSKVWFRAQPVADGSAGGRRVRHPDDVVAFFSLMDSWAGALLPRIGSVYHAVLREQWEVTSFVPAFQLRTSAAVSPSSALAAFLRDVRYGAVSSPVDLSLWPHLDTDVLVLARLARVRGPLSNLRPVDGRHLEAELQWWPVQRDGSAGLYVGQLTREGLDFAGLCAGADDSATGDLVDLEAARRTLRELTARTAEWF